MKRFTENEMQVLPVEEIIAFLAGAQHPQSIRQIADGLKLRHTGRRLLPQALKKMLHRGEVEKLRFGKFRLNPELRAARDGRSAADEIAREDPRPNPIPRTPRGDPNLFEGRLVAHRDGYGFVVPSVPIRGLAGDVFIGSEQMGDAMHGDRVSARIERRRPDGRAEGRIVHVIQHEQRTVVGIFRYDSRGNFVQPYDTRVPHEIIIPPGEELTADLREKLGPPAEARRGSRGVRLPELDGAVVNVEITRFPRSGVTPAGRVLEIIGKPGDMGVDVEIILRKHHLPHIFPDEVLAEARAISPVVSEADLTGRNDFRDLPIVTIDGETAKDFDDAVLVRPLPGGGHELQVHIADVAHYVRPNSALDREARLRGTSVYFPDRAIPMLPEELSNGICSLNPRVDRLVLSVRMHFDAAGQRTFSEFMPGVIRSAERMTYTAVNAVLKEEPEALKRYGALADEFRGMRDLALVLNKKRMARGSIDFDLPEAVLQFDENSRIIAIVRSERNIAHRIIEEFMLAANEAVAAELERRQLGFLHRVHEKPDPQKVLEFEQVARTFGYTLGVEELFERHVIVRHGAQRNAGRHGGAQRRGHSRSQTGPLVVARADTAHFDISPRHYQQLTQKLSGRPEERILSYLMLRSLRQARYSADPLGHFALAATNYTHFTSPIRRYPDLIVHRVLKWALANPEAVLQTLAHDHPRRGAAHARENVPLRGPYARAVLDQMASETSEAERRADAAERELMDWKTAQFMESHLGDEFDALIISVQKFGFFVELLDIFVEGLVPVNRLEEVFGERFLHREQDHSYVGQRSRTAFRLGDRVRVRAERIDPIFHRVEFSPVDAQS
jgi:ribonuclease R